MTTFKIPKIPKFKRRSTKNAKSLKTYLDLNVYDDGSTSLIELKHVYHTHLQQKADLLYLQKHGPFNKTNSDEQNFCLVIFNTHITHLCYYIQSLEFPSRQLFITFKQLREELINFYDPHKTNTLLQFKLIKQNDRFPYKARSTSQLNTTYFHDYF